MFLLLLFHSRLSSLSPAVFSLFLWPTLRLSSIPSALPVGEHILWFYCASPGQDDSWLAGIHGQVGLFENLVVLYVMH